MEKEQFLELVSDSFEQAKDLNIKGVDKNEMEIAICKKIGIAKFNVSFTLSPCQNHRIIREELWDPLFCTSIELYSRLEQAKRDIEILNRENNALVDKLSSLGQFQRRFDMHVSLDHLQSNKHELSEIERLNLWKDYDCIEIASQSAPESIIAEPAKSAEDKEREKRELLRAALEKETMQQEKKKKKKLI